MLPLARESELPVAVATEICGLPTAEERTGWGVPGPTSPERPVSICTFGLINILNL